MTHHEIVTRAEAKARGLKTYFTGKPCLRGHVALRQVSSETCMDCANEKAKRYYQQNKGAAIARRLDAYRRDAEAERAKMRDHYQRNKARASVARKARYYADPEAARAQSREWAAQNPAMRKAHHAKRRARKLNATPGWGAELTDFVMHEAADLAARREHVTGFAWHVDHMIPLQARSMCGLHVWNNLQVIPAALNIAKRNRLVLTHPGEWVRQA